MGKKQSRKLKKQKGYYKSIEKTVDKYDVDNLTMDELFDLDGTSKYAMYLMVEEDLELNKDNIVNFKLGIGKRVLERQSVLTQGNSQKLYIYTSWLIDCSLKKARSIEKYWHKLLQNYFVAIKGKFHNEISCIARSNNCGKTEWFFTQQFSFLLNEIKKWAELNNYKEYSRDFHTIEEIRELRINQEEKVGYLDLCITAGLNDGTVKQNTSDMINKLREFRDALNNANLDTIDEEKFLSEFEGIKNSHSLTFSEA